MVWRLGWLAAAQRRWRFKSSTGQGLFYLNCSSSDSIICEQRGLQAILHFFSLKQEFLTVSRFGLHGVYLHFGSGQVIAQMLSRIKIAAHRLADLPCPPHNPLLLRKEACINIMSCAKVDSVPSPWLPKDQHMLQLATRHPHCISQDTDKMASGTYLIL